MLILRFISLVFSIWIFVIVLLFFFDIWVFFWLRFNVKFFVIYFLMFFMVCFFFVFNFEDELVGFGGCILYLNFN